MVVLQRRAATEAMKLVDQVEKEGIECDGYRVRGSIVSGKDVNAALFDMNDPGKWPESFILARRRKKGERKARWREGASENRSRYIAADDDEQSKAQNENIGNEDGERGTHQRAFRTRFERVGVYECCRCRVVRYAGLYRERRVGDLASFSSAVD